MERDAEEVGKLTQFEQRLSEVAQSGGVSMRQAAYYKQLRDSIVA